MQQSLFEFKVPTPWHIVRNINFMLQLDPVESYSIFLVRSGSPGHQKFFRIIWRKDSFMIKCAHTTSRLRCWLALLPGDRIEDSFGRVLLRVSDYQEKRRVRKVSK